MADTLERMQLVLGDRYLFERELGRGGMATVYLARDIKHDRQVAVKVLLPDLSASIGAERFEREIRLAGRLQHPHILGMYDSGVADGLLYYVMPFVEGESLRDKIDRQGQLPVDDALQIALEVADALGYAHKQQIIHRDIKPENILLSGGHALVADFGIARAIEAGSQKLTQTGMAIGTPTYMSPEQGMGEAVGPTTDIYALGCVLFEMLAGEPPFTGKTSTGILAKHVMEQVPSLRIIRSAAPAEVEMAIFAAMGKSPADRPQTCEAFAEMLVSAPTGHTSTRLMTMRHTAARRTGGGMTGAFGVPMAAPLPIWRRTPVMIAAAVILLGGGFAAWKVAGHKGVKPGATGVDAKRIAVLYFEDAKPSDSLRVLADGLTENLIQNLGMVQGLSIVSRGGVEAYRDAKITPDSVARALGAGTLVRGSVERMGDKIHVTVHLADAGSNTDLTGSPQSFDLPAANLTAVRDSTVQKAATMIRAGIGSEVLLRQQRQGTSNADAWLALQRAERLRKNGNAAAADSALAAAEAIDDKWPDPIVARARLAYEESRKFGLDHAQDADAPIQRGLAHIDRALKVEAQNADALELRGNLSYWRWLLRLEQDPTKAKQLIAAARADLEQATTINPNQAGAWASLSHLYNNVPDVPLAKVNIAANNAWNADAFLSNAATVLARLFLSSYDLADWIQAKHWCEETQRRFPAGLEAPRCKLFLMTGKNESAPKAKEDVAAAWHLADSIVARAAKARHDFQRLNSDLLVAMVLAKAGFTDSARHVLDRSRGSADIDPTRDLLQFAAYVDILLKDNTTAINDLTTFLAAMKGRKDSFATNGAGWWYDDLKTLPAWKSLVGPGG